MPPGQLGKLIASYGSDWLNCDGLGVPRGPCRMCKRCCGFPGHGLLYWPQLPDDLDPVLKPGPGALGESSRCGRCDCPNHQHQNLELWLMDVKQRAKQIRFVSWYRPLPSHPRLPSSAPGWSRTASALFALTEGSFDPRRCAVKGPRPQGTEEKPLVSVIAPTSSVRKGFHPLLYQCFCQQDYEPKELVIIETGPEASSFLQQKAAEDPRLIYRHFRVADSRLDLPEGWKKGAPASLGISDQDLWDSLGVQPIAWSLGMKRNVAIELAAGEIIAHFDDDDLYAPGYLSWMQERLRNVLKKSQDGPGPQAVTSEHMESQLPPAAVTLKAWHLLDLSDMTFGYMDVENDPLVPKDQRFGWLFGWGFSYMFTRSCWELTPVPDVEWSEDVSFYEDLRRLKVPVVPVKPPGASRAICAHSYHAKVNTSGGEFSGAVRCGQALQETPEDLVDLMPLARQAAGRVPKRLDQTVGEKSGFRVSLSEKHEFLQCRGQAWFAYQQQKIIERKNATMSVATWPSPCR